MPITNLQFKGITRSPSDLNAPDGDLAESINVISEDQEIKPIIPPKHVVDLQGELLYIHNVASVKNYITRRKVDGAYIGASLSEVVNFHNSDGELIRTIDFGNVDITSIGCVGNTIAISTTKGIEYFLYKDGAYIALGQKPPFPVFQFGLSASAYNGSEEVKTVSLTGGNPIFSLPENDQKAVKNSILAQITSYISDAKSRSKFLFPFFVRYAYKLYDGSYIMHSAPILMYPSTYWAPFTVVLSSMNASGTSMNHTLYGVESSLHYAYKSLDTSECGVGANTLSNWADIIVGVDVFISAPLYNYCEKAFVDNDLGTFYEPASSEIISVHGNRGYVTTSGDSGRIGINWVLLNNFASAVGSKPAFTIPNYSNDIQDKNVSECSLFYLLTEIPLKQILDGSTQSNTITLDDDYLSSLINKPVLPDDYMTHCRLYATASYNYNSRLTLAGLRQKAYKGCPYLSAHIKCSSNKSYRYYFYLRKGNKTIIVSPSPAASLEQYSAEGYIFYPDTDAYKCVISRTVSGTTTYRSVDLLPHKGLNGSIAFKGYDTAMDSYGASIEGAPVETSEVECFYELPNKIYQSQVSNSFYFPLSGITEVGLGEILAIHSNAVEVSSGQFGQYPLYVFATDGIWALEVNSNGEFSRRVPISRDVCTNTASIINASRTLLFVSDRGLMAINGTEITCLSDKMTGKSQRLVETLLHIDCGTTPWEDMIDNVSDDISFKDFLKSCFLAYDYSHNRILLLNNRRKYCYVLSLSNATFGKMYTGDKYVVAKSNYTESYIQTENGELFDLNAVTDENNLTKRQYGLIVSRPVKFDTISLKTIKHIIARKQFVKAGESYARLAVYGSRDGINYYSLSTLRGNPYKYFIFAVYLYMLPKERLSCLSIEYETRFENKLR